MSIPSGTKFHGVAPGVETENKGSALANAGRDAYTIEEIAGAGTSDTYSLNSTTDGDNVDLNLDAVSGPSSTVQLTAGTGVSITQSGGNDVIDKEGYRYNKAGVYPVVDGPAMRLLIDFADTDHAWSIIPTGQSGNVMSQHYSDQAHMFNNGKYRIINTNKKELSNERVLILEP